MTLGPTATGATTRRCTWWRSSDGRVVGTCRLLLDGDVSRLGRMVVEPGLRGHGRRARGCWSWPTAWRATPGAGGSRLHAQTCAARRCTTAAGYEERGRRVRGAGHRARGDGEAPLPELRIDPLVGPAGDRRRRARRPPGRLARRRPQRPPSTPRPTLPRGPRGPHAARGLRRAPGGRPARHAGLARARGAQPLPALDPATGATPADPLAAGRGEPDLFASRPGHRRARGGDQRPRAGVLAARPGPGRAGEAMDVWRERMRAHAGRGLRAPDRERGQAGRRVAAPHPRAALRAALRARRVARERERFTAYHDRTQGRNLLADLLQEEVRRGERIVAVDAEAVALCPFASRCPSTCRSCRAPRGRAVRGRRARGRGRAAHEVLRRLEPRSATARRSTSGSAPRRPAPSASAGGSTCCRAWPSRPAWRWAPGVHLCVLAPERARRAAARRPARDAGRLPRVASRRCRPPNAHCPARRRAAAGARCPTGAGARRWPSTSAPPPRASRPTRSWASRATSPGFPTAPGAGAPTCPAPPPRPRASSCSASCPTRASTRAPRPRPSAAVSTAPTRPPRPTPTGRSTSPTRRSATGAGRRARRGVITLVWGVSLVPNGAVATAELGPDHHGPVRAGRGPLHARLAGRLHGRLRGGRAFGAAGAELARESLYEDEE